MMSNRSNSPLIHSRPRSNSHPVRPQRSRILPGEVDEDAPVRLPRSHARNPALGQVPLSRIASGSTTASQHDCWEVKMESEGYSTPLDAPPSKSLVNKRLKARGVPPLPQINTLDRKILQELKLSMLARSAQFTLKNGTKHHPFPSDEVPYPRSYDHKCLDTDVWETLFCEQYCGNVTFHTFDVPPTKLKVLDVGCGSGSWIMACAQRWKDCHFVGLDVVPLHPDLGRSDLGQRISWVQANFLEPLPFANDEFDFVHIKRIARGVPQDKWDALFREILRVMKSGAVFEMLEEDLYIPGRVMDPIDNDSLSSATPSSGSSSEELSQSSVPFASRTSTSLPDISTTGYFSFQNLRRSISGGGRIPSPGGQATADSFPPPIPRPTSSTSNGTIRHPFKLNSILSKRSGREDWSEIYGQQSQRTKKGSLLSSLGLSGPFSKPYLNESVTLSNLTLRSNTTIQAPQMSPQGLHVIGERDTGFSLPPVTVESPIDELEYEFLQGDWSPQSLSPPFPYPTPEDDRRWQPPPNILSSLDSGLFHELEPRELNQWEGDLLIPPVPPAKDIPGRSTPLAISLSPSSSDVSSSVTGLSLSGPDSRFTDHSDHNEDQSISPTSRRSGPRKYQSTTSLAINTSSSTGRAPSQNDHSTNDSGVDSSPIISTSAEMPPNPRQHKLLDVIYTEMHAARSVNLAPISLIDNCIRTHFKSVHTRLPLIFAFPPPPGCPHRPEFDASELRQRQLDQQRENERDGGQNMCLGPEIYSFPLPPGGKNRSKFDETPLPTRPMASSSNVSQINSIKSTSPRLVRDRSFSVTSNEPGPSSRARATSIQSGHSFTADPETTNHRHPSFKSLRPSIRPFDRTVPDLVVTGEGPTTGMNVHAMMDSSSAGRHFPARVAGNEWERSRQRSDSFSVRPNDVKAKGVDNGARKRLLSSRPWTADRSPPPSAFAYGNISAASSSPSIPTFSSPTTTIIRRDTGKGKWVPTEADVSQLGLLSANKLESNTRSLSLHLRVRVIEIIGCSEAMWEWILEFQTREREKEKKRKEKLALAARTAGTGGGRVTYYQDRNRNRGDQEKKGDGQLAVSFKTGDGGVGFYHQDHVRDHGSQGPLVVATKAKKVGAGGGRVGHLQATNRSAREKENSEKLALAAKASKELLSPIFKASGKLPTPAVKPHKPPKPLRVGGGRSSYNRKPTKPSGRERANSGATDRSTLSPQSPTRSSTIGTGSRSAPSMYSVTSSGSRKTVDPYDRIENSVKQELLHMTRERFNEVLSWFQFDMDDSIRLTHSMITRTDCAPFPTEPSEKRKSFDEACQKLEAHLKLHPKLPTPLAESPVCGLPSGSSHDGQQTEEELCCMPTLLNLVHPSKRSCRTIRVWIAWKP